MTRVILDPTSERNPAQRERLPRIAGLEVGAILEAQL